MKWERNFSSNKKPEDSQSDGVLEDIANLDSNPIIGILSFYQITKNGSKFFQIEITADIDKLDLEKAGITKDKFPNLTFSGTELRIECAKNEKEKMAAFLDAVDSIDSLDEIYDDLRFSYNLPNLKEINKQEKKQAVAIKTAGTLFQSHPTHPQPREIGEIIGSLAPDAANALARVNKGTAGAAREEKAKIEEKQESRLRKK